MTESERASARCALNSMELEAFGLARDLSDSRALTTYAPWAPASAPHAAVQICTRPNATRRVRIASITIAPSVIAIASTSGGAGPARRGSGSSSGPPQSSRRCAVSSAPRVIGSPLYLVFTRRGSRMRACDGRGRAPPTRRPDARRAPRHTVRYHYNHYF